MRKGLCSFVFWLFTVLYGCKYKPYLGFGTPQHSPMHSTWHCPPGIGVMKWEGNSCFFNSALCALGSLKYFREELASKKIYGPLHVWAEWMNRSDRTNRDTLNTEKLRAYVAQKSNNPEINDKKFGDAQTVIFSVFKILSPSNEHKKYHEGEYPLGAEGVKKLKEDSGLFLQTIFELLKEEISSKNAGKKRSKSDEMFEISKVNWTYCPECDLMRVGLYASYVLDDAVCSNGIKYCGMHNECPNDVNHMCAVYEKTYIESPYCFLDHTCKRETSRPKIGKYAKGARLTLNGVAYIVRALILNRNEHHYVTCIRESDDVWYWIDDKKGSVERLTASGLCQKQRGGWRATSALYERP